MINQREFLLGTLLLALLSVSTAVLFARVVKQESAGDRTLLELPSEPSVWTLRSADKCFGTLRLSFNQGEISFLELIGEFRLQYRSTQLPMSLKSHLFFNQLGQLFSASAKIKADLYSLAVESREINPIRVAVDLTGGPEPIHYDTEFQGPVKMTSNSEHRLLLTSPHRIRQRREISTLIPAAWPVTLTYSLEQKGSKLACADSDFFFDLGALMPFLQDLIPGFAILPTQILQGYQDGHA